MSPDPTPDLDRLARMAPTVDLDEATAAFGAVRRRGRRRRRRALAGAGALLAVLAVAGLVSVRSERGAPVDVVAGPAGEVPDPAVAELGGLRLELEGPERAVVGERIRAVVTLTNTTDEPIRAAEVAGCDDQVGAAVRSVGSDALVGRRYLPEGADPDDVADPMDERGLLPAGLGPAVAWDGDAASLPATLERAAEPEVWRGEADGACVAMFTPPEEIAPGASVRREVPIDLRWGRAAPSGDYELVAVGGGPVDANGMAVDGSWPPPEIMVAQPIEIVDDPAREPAASAALEALPATPTLDEWIVETADLDAVAGFRQRWYASQTWWRGGWETWIDPMAGHGHQADPLRIRFDPARGEIVDVRTVFWGGTPSDDPDAEPSPTGEPLDAIRYQAP